MYLYGLQKTSIERHGLYANNGLPDSVAVYIEINLYPTRQIRLASPYDKTWYRNNIRRAAYGLMGPWICHSRGNRSIHAEWVNAQSRL